MKAKKLCYLKKKREERKKLLCFKKCSSNNFREFRQKIESLSRRKKLIIQNLNFELKTTDRITENFKHIKLQTTITTTTTKTP